MLAMEYLQSGGPDCPVTSALLEMMAKDSSPDVRRCIINMIVLSDSSIEGSMCTARLLVHLPVVCACVCVCMQL